MKIEVINKEKMEALQALADTNIKVGEARGTLTKIKSEESEYLKEREEKTLQLVQNILDESEEVLKKAFSNYEEIKKLSSDASDFSQFLIDSYDEFQELKNTFTEYTEAWGANIAGREKSLAALKRQLGS